MPSGRPADERGRGPGAHDLQRRRAARPGSKAPGLGFTGIAGAASSMAQMLFFVFLVLLIVAGIASAVRGRPPA